MLPNENFISHVEEHFINWDDDAEMMNILDSEFFTKTRQLIISMKLSARKNGILPKAFWKQLLIKKK